MTRHAETVWEGETEVTEHVATTGDLVYSLQEQLAEIGLPATSVHGLLVGSDTRDVDHLLFGVRILGGDALALRTIARLPRALRADEVARVMRARDELGQRQGIVVANPIPAEQQWDPAEHDRVLAEAFAAAELAGVRGKAVTPFLLGFIVDASEGRSLEVNLDLDAQVTGGRRAAPEPREMSWTELVESRQARMSIGDPAVEVICLAKLTILARSGKPVQ